MRGYPSRVWFLGFGLRDDPGGVTTATLGAIVFGERRLSTGGLMTHSKVIAATSDGYTTVVDAATEAAKDFDTAGTHLTTAIATGAFGSAGDGIVSAGNGVGEALADSLRRLSVVVEELASVVQTAGEKFEGVEADAVAYFQELESELDE